MYLSNSLTLLFLVSITSLAAQLDHFRLPQKIVISGRINQHERFPDRSSISFFVVDLSTMDQVEYTSGIDTSGNFSVQFERYLPQDIYVGYGGGFQLIVQPGDSINLEFKAGRFRSRMLRSVTVSGESAEVNASFFRYQRKCANLLSNRKNTKWTRKYDAAKYRARWEKRVQLRRRKDDQFVRQYQPPKLLQDWIRNNTEADYHRLLLFYPGLHKSLHQLPRDTVLAGEEYYSFLDDFPAYDTSSLFNTSTARHLTISYAWSYFGARAQREFEADTTLDRDAILLEKLFQHLRSDTILFQLSLASFLNYCLSNYDLEKFHRYARQWIGEELRFPFLVKPLQERARLLQDEIAHPQLNTQTILQRFTAGREDQLLAKIIEDNQGKVIYLDVWATWCAPCLQEMPISKVLHEKLAADEVTFVYLCIESPAFAWEPMLAKMQLPGQQYFLDKEQSRRLREAFGIVGIPFYLLIDSRGNIIEKGSHLRPGRRDTLEKINRAISGN